MFCNSLLRISLTTQYPGIFIISIHTKGWGFLLLPFFGFPAGCPFNYKEPLELELRSKRKIIGEAYIMYQQKVGTFKKNANSNTSD